MASSYSPLLRLELMATGEKSGLWGNVTNTNLSTILEQAIAGTVEISITGASSPITLTVANGASDQSRTAILRITGTNASPISIVAPATSKLYFVKNASDQPITIKTSTSTGVAVAVGDSRFIFYDTVTTDFALGPSSVVTGTVSSVALSGGTTGLTVSGSPITSSGTITIGGTLAVTNGGTGATSATQAINNLLPSQTGQASKYLKTNGTNVSWDTAGGGTVTSVAVTTALSGISITGSPVTSSGTIAITGTLGIGSGGTGQTTANAAFNALAPSQTSNANKFLKTDGTNTSWASAVTSIIVSGGTTGLAFSGNPITSSGTLLMSGVLAVGSGGTGATNAGTAINNLLPLQTGNSGKVLSTDGSNVSWTTVSGGGGGGGTVTSVAFNPGTTGFSVTGSPITSSGTINLAGTLNIANGGTGATTDTVARSNLSAAKSGANSDITSLTGLTTALSASQGGTGNASYSSGDLLYASGSTTLSRRAIGTTGQILTVSGGVPTWANPASVTSISFGSTGLTPSSATNGVVSVGGVLNVLNGGTGATNAGTAINNLLPLQTGNSGKVLSTNGSNVSWTTVSGGGGGTVTSVAFNPGTTGFSITGSPITSSGTINLAGTLNIANGGTGTTTANGALNNLLPSQTGNTGKALITNGTNTSWFPVVTSISFGSTGLTPSSATAGVVSVGGTLAVTNGGTGATSESGARSNLGLGTLATQNTVNLSSQVTGTLSVSSLSTGSAGQVLTMSGGTPTWVTSSGGGGGQIRSELITSTGSWTVPAGVTRIRVSVVAGGGCSINTPPSGGNGAPGGSGGAGVGEYTVSPGTTYSVTIGAGGSGSNYTSGGATSFGNLISATGGQRATTLFNGLIIAGLPGTTSGANIRGSCRHHVFDTSNLGYSDVFHTGGTLTFTSDGILPAGYPATYDASEDNPFFGWSGTSGAVYVEWVG